MFEEKIKGWGWDKTGLRRKTEKVGLRRKKEDSRVRNKERLIDLAVIAFLVDGGVGVGEGLDETTEVF